VGGGGVFSVLVETKREKNRSSTMKVRVLKLKWTGRGIDAGSCPLYLVNEDVKQVLLNNVY
jgi:formylmethanofuran dehydrogenase subunit C